MSVIETKDTMAPSESLKALSSSAIPARPSLLDVLRSQSSVDVDSLDSAFAASLAPFVDATSNQAIALTELSKPSNGPVLSQACDIAAKEKAAGKWPELTLVALAVEVAQVLIALKMAPHLTGRFHIQANPLDAYSVARTVRCGERLEYLVSMLASPQVARSLCLKVPATWEGLMACEKLEKDKNIRTLATTLFTKEQGILAGEVGCTYIAPYVNELPVHFVAGHTDPEPNNQLVVDLQKYYQVHNTPTKVLPASLTTPAECMLLAGAHHITIAPVLLQALASTPAPPADEMETLFPSIFKRHSPDDLSGDQNPISYLKNETMYRLAVTRRDKGKQEKKLIDAINIFSGMQEKLESLLRGMLEQEKIAESH